MEEALFFSEPPDEPDEPPEEPEPDPAAPELDPDVPELEGVEEDEEEDDVSPDAAPPPDFELDEESLPDDEPLSDLVSLPVFDDALDDDFDDRLSFL